jgi:FAD/FMN-containing dehydrogenase
MSVEQSPAARIFDLPGDHSAAADCSFELGPRYLTRLEGWGMAVHSYSYVYRPVSQQEIRAVFDLARRSGLSIALRGAGRSYGDASINQRGIVLDMSRMNRILSWNPETGVIEVEPGVTIQSMWQTTIVDGYWPAVVSGTMFTTMGGCAAMNIHGKNNFQVGPFGNQILDFDFMLPDGTVLTCSRSQNAELFHAAISGFGMLGVFTRLSIQTKKVYSGKLLVEVFRTRSLAEMVDEFEDRYERSDYLVGWIDCIARGRSLGRGIVHRATYLPPEADPRPNDSLNVASQELPSKILGVFPKSMTHFLMRPFVNNLGMRLINTAKYYSGFLAPQGACYYQSHGGFAFLLDYVPNWKLAYRPGGLIQYQSFIPKRNAVQAFEKILRTSQEAGLPPYLGVFKKHSPDPFLLTHSLDGYSLALDFRVTQANRRKLWDLASRLDRIVLNNGGKFYFAKDATLRPETVRWFFGEETVDKFLALKKQCDPDNLLQSDLSRRLFGAFES